MLRLGLILLCLSSACGGRQEEIKVARAGASLAADTARPWRKPGDKIDSILPMPEYLRRFREGLTEPKGLTGGTGSRAALARRFLAAVTARDTTAFTRLLVNRAEFAWLVFPNHLYHDPPYELDPEIFWMQVRMQGAKGLGRTLDRLGGHDLAFERLDCARDTVQARRGPVKLWSSCRLRFRDGDSVVVRRVFGSIVELGGRFKLLSGAADY